LGEEEEGAGGAQRPVLSVNKPKRRVRGQNLLVVKYFWTASVVMKLPNTKKVRYSNIQTENRGNQIYKKKYRNI
jgi:hypothetical protein